MVDINLVSLFELIDLDTASLSLGHLIRVVRMSAGFLTATFPMREFLLLK